MSEVKTNDNNKFSRVATEARYRRGNKILRMGTEIETILVHPSTGSNKRAAMMMPVDSQNIMRDIAQVKGAEVFSEQNGKRVPGIVQGLPIVCVDANNVSWQLELSGVLEAATDAYPLDEINSLLEKVQQAQNSMAQYAAPYGLIAYDGSVLGSATVDDCEKNMVNRQRLVSEWEKFKLDGLQSPGLRTMGLAASTQVSVGYRNEQELKEILQLGNLLSPLLTAAFANGNGFEEGIKRDRISRPQWWLAHNQYAPRGGVPDFALDLMFEEDAKDPVTGWMNYVQNVPMVYYINGEGNPEFEDSPTFNELSKTGLGTQTNYALAESLTWPDVKLIGGQRVEMRMCDTGPWQPTALTVLCAGLLANEQGRKQALEIMYATGINKEQFVQSRKDVVYNSLDTEFGNTNLRELLPSVFSLARDNALAMGVKSEYIEPLTVLLDNPVSDFETRKGQYPTAEEADWDLCKNPSVYRPPLVGCNA